MTQVDASGLVLTTAGRVGDREDRAGTPRDVHVREQTERRGAGGALAIIVYDNPGNSLFSSGSVTVGQATLPALFVNLADGLDLQSRVANNPGLQVTLDFSGAAAFPARTDVSSFSSRGPSLGSALKPDLAAVGEEIVTGAQSVNSGGESYSASGFIDTAGTSFSAPLAAGAAAVLKGARPGLGTQQYRSLLVHGAMGATVSDGVAATVSQAGAGVPNLLAAVTGTVAAHPTSLNFDITGAAYTVQLSLNVGHARHFTSGRWRRECPRRR